MLLIKDKFKYIIIIIISIICQVTPDMTLSNIITVKMFLLKVNFTKSIIELHVLLITYMPVKNFKMIRDQ